MHTTDVATFQAANFGKVGYVYNGQAFYCRNVTNLHTTQSEFSVDNLTSLPKVGIVYGYANCSPAPMKAFMDANFDGIVLAGVGDGNFYKDVFDVALQARAKGINIVRSSRVPTGPTCLNGEVDDSKYHFVAALTLNPQKARVAYACAHQDARLAEDTRVFPKILTRLGFLFIQGPTRVLILKPFHDFLYRRLLAIHQNTHAVDLSAKPYHEESGGIEQNDAERFLPQWYTERNAHHHDDG